MTTHSYTAEISSAETLYQSLVNNGVDMVISIIKCIPEYSGKVATGNTIIDITTDSDLSTCNTAVSEALAGTLLSNKQIKKKEISDKSTELSKSGMPHTTASGNSGVFPIEKTKEELSFYNTLVDALTSNPSEAPQIIPTVDDLGVQIMNLSEATALSDDARHRMEYIYSSVAANADSSKSQLLLDSEIDSAVNQSDLDLITDTRS